MSFGIDISYGQTINGRLESDSILTFYNFQGNAGDEIEIRLDSSDFDALLSVIREDPEAALDRGPGDPADFFVTDDDSGGNYNALIRTTLPVAAEYRVFVSSYARGSSGNFTLSLARVGSGQAGTSNKPGTQVTGSGTVLQFGESRQGTLDNSDQRANDKFYDLFLFSGTRGQNVILDLRGMALDPYLILYSTADPNIPLAEDDDGGDD